MSFPFVLIRVDHTHSFHACCLVKFPVNHRLRLVSPSIRQPSLKMADRIVFEHPRSAVAVRKMARNVNGISLVNKLHQIQDGAHNLKLLLDC